MQNRMFKVVFEYFPDFNVSRGDRVSLETYSQKTVSKGLYLVIFASFVK